MILTIIPSLFKFHQLFFKTKKIIRNICQTFSISQFLFFLTLDLISTAFETAKKKNAFYFEEVRISYLVTHANSYKKLCPLLMRFIRGRKNEHVIFSSHVVCLFTDRF